MERRSLFSIVRLRQIGIFGIVFATLVATLYGSASDAKQNEQIIVGDSASLRPCWYVSGPGVNPTATLTSEPITPEMEATLQAVKYERSAMIQATQAAVIENSAQRDEIWGKLGKEYIQAVVKMEFFAGEDSEKWPYMWASGLIVGAEDVQISKHPIQEQIPVWYILTSNHTDFGLNDRIRQGETIHVALRNIKVNDDTSDQPDELLGDVVACHVIVDEAGQSIAELFTVKGKRGNSIGSLPGYDKPFPVENLGGPCTFEDEALATVGFPSSVTTKSYTAVFSDPIYERDKVGRSGEVYDILTVIGGVEHGASGSAVKDIKRNAVCAVVNYASTVYSNVVGLMVLPDRRELLPIVTKFMIQQQKVIQGQYSKAPNP